MKHAGGYHWTISLHVDCPYCEESFDAFDTLDTEDCVREFGGLQIAQGKKGVKVECPFCDEEFIFDVEDGL